MDLREKKLAEKLVNYSCSVKKGEKVLIQYSSCSDSLINALIDEIYKVGAYPILRPIIKSNQRHIMLGADEEYFKFLADIDSYMMEKMDAVILIGGSNNTFEYSDVPESALSAQSKYHTKPVHFDIRCSKKWVLLGYPTPSFAQSARMSTEKFEDFYYQVCTMDYAELDKNLTPLEKLMNETDKVHIVAKNTDLTFSIKGIPAIKCVGECNIPDGEIYTAPVKDSINGHIEFNIPTKYDGKEFTNIYLEFENGKIVSHKCNNDEAFEKIISVDESARYVGEFSFGVNRFVTQPIHDILFDEKMGCSIHMALGSSYDDAYNGNKSAIHWDLIQCHKKEYGGGKIYFDDKLIYENGDFVPTNLVALNK